MIKAAEEASPLPCPPSISCHNVGNVELVTNVQMLCSGVQLHAIMNDESANFLGFAWQGWADAHPKGRMFLGKECTLDDFSEEFSTDTYCRHIEGQWVLSSPALLFCQMRKFGIQRGIKDGVLKVWSEIVRFLHKARICTFFVAFSCSDQTSGNGEQGHIENFGYCVEGRQGDAYRCYFNSPCIPRKGLVFQLISRSTAILLRSIVTKSH